MKYNLPVISTHNFGAWTLQNCNLWKKLVVWYILTIVSQKHSSLALAIKIFTKTHLKMKSLNILKINLHRRDGVVVRTSASQSDAQNMVNKM